MDVEDRQQLLIHLISIRDLGYGMPVLHINAITDLVESNLQEDIIQTKLLNIILLGKLRNAVRQVETLVPDWTEYMSDQEWEQFPPEVLN